MEDPGGNSRITAIGLVSLDRLYRGA